MMNGISHCSYKARSKITCGALLLASMDPDPARRSQTCSLRGSTGVQSMGFRAALSVRVGQRHGVSSSFLGFAKPCCSLNRRAIFFRNEESVQIFLKLRVNLRSALSEGAPCCILLAASK
jgi:hypothetical protein